MKELTDTNDARRPEIDRLRGFIIVLMALDHMRDFLDADSLRFSPVDLSHTYPALFFTRIVTHLCAPTFAILAGAGSWLYGDRINDPKALSRFLAARGLWLIALDIIVISPVFAGGSGKIELGTLWAIGCGLLALSMMSRLGDGKVLFLGLAIVFFHNTLDSIKSVDLGAFGPWWRLMHEKGSLPLEIPGSVHYPAFPWIGVVAIGYGIGPLFKHPWSAIEKTIRLAGYSSLMLFFILRSVNLYGDPNPWTHQSSLMLTLFSFLNVSKYPPSLQYLLLTLGVSALIMTWLGRPDSGVSLIFGDALAVFGRTPLFFYILHLYAGIMIGLGVMLFQGYNSSALSGFIETGNVPENLGLGLAGAYAGWMFIVLVLYPICKAFDQFKRTRKDLWILRYL